MFEEWFREGNVPVKGMSPGMGQKKSNTPYKNISIFGTPSKWGEKRSNTSIHQQIYCITPPQVLGKIRVTPPT